MSQPVNDQTVKILKIKYFSNETNLWDAEPVVLPEHQTWAFPLLLEEVPATKTYNPIIYNVNLSEHKPTLYTNYIQRNHKHI